MWFLPLQSAVLYRAPTITMLEITKHHNYPWGPGPDRTHNETKLGWDRHSSFRACSQNDPYRRWTSIMHVRWSTLIETGYPNIFVQALCPPLALGYLYLDSYALTVSHAVLKMELWSKFYHLLAPSQFTVWNSRCTCTHVRTEVVHVAFYKAQVLPLQVKLWTVSLNTAYLCLLNMRTAWSGHGLITYIGEREPGRKISG